MSTSHLAMLMQCLKQFEMVRLLGGYKVLPPDEIEALTHPVECVMQRYTVTLAKFDEAVLRNRVVELKINLQPPSYLKFTLKDLEGDVQFRTTVTVMPDDQSQIRLDHIAGMWLVHANMPQYVNGATALALILLGRDHFIAQMASVSPRTATLDNDAILSILYKRAKAHWEQTPYLQTSPYKDDWLACLDQWHTRVEPSWRKETSTIADTVVHWCIYNTHLRYSELGTTMEELLAVGFDMDADARHQAIQGILRELSLQFDCLQSGGCYSLMAVGDDSAPMTEQVYELSWCDHTADEQLELHRRAIADY